MKKLIIVLVLLIITAAISYHHGQLADHQERFARYDTQFELGFTLGKMFVAEPVKIELTKGSYMRGVIFHGPVEIVHAHDALIYNCDFECVTDDSYNVTIPSAWGEYGAAAIYWSDPDPKGELHISGGSITGRRP